MAAPLYQLKAEFFKTLSHPARIRVLELLGQREHAVSELLPEVGVEAANLSQHLTVLRNAGLVSERREGTRRLYRARPEGLAELRSFLNGFWESGLERLKREAEQEQRKGRVARAARRN